MRPIITFVATVFVLAAALSLAIGLTGGRGSPFAPLGYVSMLLPAAAAYLLRAGMNEAPRIDWSRLPANYVPAAAALMPAVMHAAMLPAMYAVAGRLPWTNAVSWSHVALNAVVGLVVVSGLALFEEIGWRGWLLPRLAAIVGLRGAIVATSIVWALWHVPFVLSGVLFVEEFSAWRTLAIVLPGIAGAGLVIGWLWARTRSIWIAALAHGALNNWGQLAFKYMDPGPRVDLAPVLLSGSVALVVVGALLTARLRPGAGGSLAPANFAL